MRSRLDVALSLRDRSFQDIASRICIDEPAGNVVALHKAPTAGRLRSLYDGDSKPLDWEARLLGKELDFSPGFFMLDPLVMADAIHDPVCHCGAAAVVACDLCDSPFCGKHAPKEYPPGFHDCGCCDKKMKNPPPEGGGNQADLAGGSGSVAQSTAAPRGNLLPGHRKP